MGGGSASETFSRQENLQKWSFTSDERAEKWCEVTTHNSPPKLLLRRQRSIEAGRFRGTNESKILLLHFHIGKARLPSISIPMIRVNHTILICPFPK
jgi:hypothetical protein